MKFLQALIRTLFIIPLAAIVYFAIFIYMLFHPPSYSSDFNKTIPYRWNKVKLGKNAMSSDASSYHMYSKRGQSNNLIVYFSGGGMAWDARSAFAPTGITSLIRKNNFGYYFSNIPIYILVSLQGMLDCLKAENPFYGWNVVYIPYSTGDMHIGNSMAAYTQKGKIKEINHNGKFNTLACLDWIYESFENPDKVMVCGDSAGAFAAPFWVKKIAAHYSSSEIFCLSDGASLKSENWPAIIDGIWKTQFEDTFGYKPSGDPLAEAFIHTDNMPGNRIVMMHTNTVYDKTLAAYQADVNQESKTGLGYINKWTHEMLGSVKKISSSTNSYHFYLTKYGYRAKSHYTPHTITRYPRFYMVSEDSIYFTKWLDDIVNKGLRYDVGTEYVHKL